MTEDLQMDEQCSSLDFPTELRGAEYIYIIKYKINWIASLIFSSGSVSSNISSSPLLSEAKMIKYTSSQCGLSIPFIIPVVLLYMCCSFSLSG